MYDARLEQDDAEGRHFSHPLYATATATATAQSEWRRVWPMATIPNTALIIPQNMPPIQKLRKLPARTIGNPAANVFTVDFGQNTAGLVRMKVPGGLAVGANVTIFFAEVLNHPPYTATGNGTDTIHDPLFLNSKCPIPPPSETASCADRVRM